MKNSARLSAAVLALTLSLGPAGAQYAFAGPEKGSVGVSSVHIDNFGRVDANYYRGAQPQGRDYADLAALGVKTIINLTSDDALAEEKGMVEQAGMKYQQIPMTTHAIPTMAQLTEFFTVVNDPASQPVYVHCVGGRHRTGVMTAAYRINHDGWTSDQAFKEMKQFKFGADFLHSEFKQFVFGYPAALRAAAAAAGPVAGPLVKPGGQQ
ncbi:MAG TPA: dual specificity protein phosphatase family protein [Povalibacter sp.]|nr:dual specificity protein phosphatase family protein [Povalibacter sp.]